MDNNPDFFGNFPIRQDVTFLPPGIGQPLKRFALIKDLRGREIAKFSPDWEDLIKDCTYENNSSIVGALREIDDIKIGDWIITPCLWGYAKAVVIKKDGNDAMAETTDNYYPLEFAKDYRKCWTNWAQIGKDIKEIEFK